MVKEPKSNAREEHRQRDRRDGTGRCVGWLLVMFVAGVVFGWLAVWLAG